MSGIDVMNGKDVDLAQNLMVAVTFGGWRKLIVESVLEGDFVAKDYWSLVAKFANALMDSGK